MNKKDEALKMAIEALEYLIRKGEPELVRTLLTCKEALHQPAQDENYLLQQINKFKDYKGLIHVNENGIVEPLTFDDDLMSGKWIRFNDNDDTTRLLMELEVAMNGVEGSAKSPAVIDVLRQAVDYFKKPFTRDWKHTIDERIARDSEFKEALEQPAQEIVRKVFDIDNFHPSVLDRIKFTSPSQWQGLTDDEMEAIIKEKDGVFGAVVRAIEQALKDKNT